MRLTDISEGVAGPKNCWPGHRKIGTQPGTGKNAGKRVNKCEKIKESVDIADTYKGWKFEVEFQKEDDRNVTFYSAISPEGKTHMLPKRATKEQFRQFVDSKTVKEGLSDEVNPADVGEYDREGDMAIGQLKTAEDAAAELRSILDSDENLPEWVQSKITKAVDYLDTARDYMKSKEQGVAEAGFPGAPDVEMPPMEPSGDPNRDKLKQEYVNIHREIKSLVDLAYAGDQKAKARIKQLNARADEIKNILEPRKPPNEWQKKTYGYDDNWNIVKKGVSESVRDPEDWDEGTDKIPNNIEVSINGRSWKVFAGRGLPDSQEERMHLRKMQQWAASKSAATGKQWEVRLTGAPVSR